MMNVLVTGGAGYVGSILLRALLNKGYHVVCIDNLMFGGDSLIDIWHHPSFKFYRCDITDKKDVSSVIKKEKCSSVVHLAAIVGDPACKMNPDLARRVNGDASKFLFESARDCGVSRFIFASTCSNYGKMSDPDIFMDENSPLSPVSLYAELKVMFEEFMLKSDSNSNDFSPTSLRFSTIYGLSHRMRFDLTVNEFTKELVMGRELVVFGEQFWRPYCHVADLARAIITVLEAPMEKVAYSVFNVGDTEENYTKKMIVKALLREIPEGKVKYVRKEEDPRDYRVSFEKIKRSLGFQISKKLHDGIKEVKEIVQSGIIQNPEDQRYYNIPT